MPYCYDHDIWYEEGKTCSDCMKLATGLVDTIEKIMDAKPPPAPASTFDPCPECKGGGVTERCLFETIHDGILYCRMLHVKSRWLLFWTWWDLRKTLYKAGKLRWKPKMKKHHAHASDERDAGDFRAMNAYFRRTLEG